MEYVRECWYCAGFSRDFGREIATRTILETPIALWRTEAGALTAMEDLCPHRFLPLSRGALDGDTVRCGYHGMTFGVDGRCVRVPGQDHVPSNARVRVFPVEERHGVVWVWMGASERADASKIFDLPQFTAEGWTAHHGEALRLNANYLNVAENLCDPAHVTFVHPTTLGSAAGADVPVRTEKATGPMGEVIVTYRWIRNAPPIGFFKEFGGFEGDVDRWHYYHMHAPNVAAIDFGSADASRALPEDARDDGVRIFALHFLTPVDAHTTIDWWMHLRNTAQDAPGVGEKMDAMFRTAFDEDKVVLEAIEEAERRHPDRRQLNISIDLGPNLYRKAVERLLEAERAQEAAAADRRSG